MPWGHWTLFLAFSDTTGQVRGLQRFKNDGSGVDPGGSGWTRVDPGGSGGIRGDPGDPGGPGWIRADPGTMRINQKVPLRKNPSILFPRNVTNSIRAVKFRIRISEHAQLFLRGWGLEII